MEATEPCKLLVVEDHADVRGFIETVLGEEGYVLEGVKDARKARRAIARDTPDLVITDVLLPGGEDGIALARHASAQGCGVLIVTGSHAREDELQESGFHYLLKPFRMGDLVTVVRTVLRDRGTRDGAAQASA